MALTRLIISPLVLLSLVVISLANPNYESHAENPDTTSSSYSIEHSQSYKFQGDHDHHIHYLVDELLHHKEGNKPAIPQETPEYEVPTNKKAERHEYVPSYGVEKKPYSGSVVVEGLILCKSGSAYAPIQGARAIIKCQSSYKSGYNNGYYVTSSETNEEGCFVATLSMEELKEKSITLKECKAYPEYSPMQTCNVAAPNSESYLSPSRNDQGEIYYHAGSLVYTEESHHYTNDEPELPEEEPELPKEEPEQPKEKPSVPHY